MRIQWAFFAEDATVRPDGLVDATAIFHGARPPYVPFEMPPVKLLFRAVFDKTEYGSRVLLDMRFLSPYGEKLRWGQLPIDVGKDQEDRGAPANFIFAVDLLLGDYGEHQLELSHEGKELYVLPLDVRRPSGVAS